MNTKPVRLSLTRLYDTPTCHPFSSDSFTTSRTLIRPPQLQHTYTLYTHSSNNYHTHQYTPANQITQPTTVVLTHTTKRKQHNQRTAKLNQTVSSLDLYPTRDTNTPKISTPQYRQPQYAHTQSLKVHPKSHKPSSFISKNRGVTHG